MVEEATTTSADQVNVRTPRESGGKSDTEVPVLWHQRERDAPKMHGTIRCSGVQVFRCSGVQVFRC